VKQVSFGCTVITISGKFVGVGDGGSVLVGVGVCVMVADDTGRGLAVAPEMGSFPVRAIKAIINAPMNRKNTGPRMTAPMGTLRLLALRPAIRVLAGFFAPVENSVPQTAQREAVSASLVPHVGQTRPGGFGLGVVFVISSP
jgi:hypothetical protein